MQTCLCASSNYGTSRSEKLPESDQETGFASASYNSRQAPSKIVKLEGALDLHTWTRSMTSSSKVHILQLELLSREFGVTPCSRPVLAQEVFNEVPLIRAYWPTHRTCVSDVGGFSTVETAARVNSFTMTLSRSCGRTNLVMYLSGRKGSRRRCEGKSQSWCQTVVALHRWAEPSLEVGYPRATDVSNNMPVCQILLPFLFRLCPCESEDSPYFSHPENRSLLVEASIFCTTSSTGS